MASNQRNPFNKSAIIKLEHLEPNMKYIVRSIITTIDNKSFIDENLPHAAFTTKCYGTVLFIADDIIKSRSESFCANPTDSRQRQS
jgi:hypothetical protein